MSRMGRLPAGVRWSMQICGLLWTICFELGAGCQWITMLSFIPKKKCFGTSLRDAASSIVDGDHACPVTCSPEALFMAREGGWRGPGTANVGIGRQESQSLFQSTSDRRVIHYLAQGINTDWALSLWLRAFLWASCNAAGPSHSRTIPLLDTTRTPKMI